ncbi:MAG: peptidyl-prolyl cis-trans isomerase [Thermosynechococcaceae cyanobacterium MS004]|nr:peptidyl-prolyl cis-trans isomerase [Thermosynechococcaceae cyanobacterium MS004]
MNSSRFPSFSTSLLTPPEQTPPEPISSAIAKPVLTVGEEMFSPADLFEKLKTHGLLPQLCREILIDQVVSGLTPTPEESAAGLKTLYQQHQISEEPDRQRWMQQHSMTPEQFEQWSQRQSLLEVFKRRMWGAELGSYFIKRKESLDRAIYSLIRHPDRGVIQELYFRLQTGEDTIANLAAQYSQGPEHQTYGLVGPIEMGRIHPRLAQQLRAAKPHQVNSPLQLETWFVILQLESWMPAQYGAEIEQRLLDEQFQQWLEQQLQQARLQEMT